MARANHDETCLNYREKLSYSKCYTARRATADVIPRYIEQGGDTERPIYITTREVQVISLYSNRVQTPWPSLYSNRGGQWNVDDGERFFPSGPPERLRPLRKQWSFFCGLSIFLENRPYKSSC